MIIVPGDLDHPKIRALLEHHLATSRAASTACSDHALEVHELKAPDVRFSAAWDDERLLGVAALLLLANDHGEIKSMHTSTDCRRQGVGSALLLHIFETARSLGIRRLSLETGSADYFAPARALYERHGFAVCPPFADYVLDPRSVFMTRELERRA